MAAFLLERRCCPIVRFLGRTSKVVHLYVLSEIFALLNQFWSYRIEEVYAKDAMARRNHKDLILWQKALTLAHAVHEATARFPRHELFGLTGQMRRAAVSVPSNIAEGAARSTTREFIQFLHIARGSLAELETQIHLAERAGYFSSAERLLLQLEEVGKLINAVISGLRRRLAHQQR